MIVKEINGILFIDTIALERAITKDIPTKHHLREKMLRVGVLFWDNDQKIVKKPVIGISAIGGFSICLEGDLPPNTIKLRFGDVTLGPVSIHDVANGLRETMGMQSAHTYMNPKTKTASELYNITVGHQHFSLAHAATIGITCFGISKKAELEFDVQRDVVHLARETSARSSCQDEPTLVALTEEGALLSAAILENTLKLVGQFKKYTNELNWREERNSLFPLSATVSLGINGSLKNLMKLVAAMNDEGKELEFRNALALINDSLSAFLPELFKSSATYGHTYPASWRVTPTVASTRAGFFSAVPPKQAILLLGAPGVGKSTQTELIMKQLPGVMCVSTGNLIRKLEAKKAAGIVPLTATESWAAESLDKMRRGDLMDDQAVYALLMAHLSAGGEGYAEYSKSHTIILDGIIKSERNIVPCEQALAQFNQTSQAPMKLTKVINITASTPDLLARQQSRVQTALANGQTPRPDDDFAVYQQRLEEYLSSMQQVTSYFESHSNFIEVDGSKEMDATTKALIAAIQQTEPTKELQHAAN